ncbi:hypothetical protein ACM26S_07715 [Kluyvera sichuanensis]|uniref:hypothetical protein n=1 Tax=Kluyvera sichuanensis TaxID=2725494 RepID=UPI0039F64A0B
MVEGGSYVFDASFLPANLSALIVVLDDLATYICEQAFAEVLDGHWLIIIDGTYSIRLITRLSKGMIKISTAENSFECAFFDIKVFASVRSTIVSN